MQNTIKVSNSVIENYKNNRIFLKDLKQRIESGSFKAYDIALYNALSKKNVEDDTNKLILSIM